MRDVGIAGSGPDGGLWRAGTLEAAGMNPESQATRRFALKSTFGGEAGAFCLEPKPGGRLSGVKSRLLAYSASRAVLESR